MTPVYLQSCPNSFYLYICMSWHNATCIFSCHGTMHDSCTAFLSKIMAHVSLPSWPNAWQMYICRPVTMHAACIFACHGTMHDTCFCAFMSHCIAKLFSPILSHWMHVAGIFICLSSVSSPATWKFFGYPVQLHDNILYAKWFACLMLNSACLSRCQLLFDLHILACVLIPLRIICFKVLITW